MCRTYYTKIKNKNEANIHKYQNWYVNLKYIWYIWHYKIYVLNEFVKSLINSKLIEFLFYFKYILMLLFVKKKKTIYLWVQ